MTATDRVDVINTATTVPSRTSTVQALRDAADFLEAHPDVPEPWGGQEVAWFPGDRAEFINLGRRIGATEVVETTGLVRANRQYGAVRLSVCITKERIATSPSVDLDGLRNELTEGT